MTADYPMKRYYRIDEVAKYFAIFKRTVCRLMGEGNLRGIKIRKCPRVQAAEIQRFEETLLPGGKGRDREQ